MLTGDENIVDVDFSVFWKVKPTGVGEYLFNIQNPEGTVKAVAESAMREVIGRSDIQPILTGARQTIEAAVQDLMQKTLDHYGAGILIQQVQLQKVDPPTQVIDAFRDVQAARVDSSARSTKRRPTPTGWCRKRAATSPRSRRPRKPTSRRPWREATGQTSRFLKIYEQYKKAPDVTRERMYLETMERVLGGADKIIIDSEQGGTGVVPYLPLNELARAAAAAQPAARGRPAMKLNFIGGVVAVLAFAALIIVYTSLFTVYQTQQALVVRLGQVVRVVNEPGLHVKVPFIDNVIDIDKRILDLEAPAQEVIASDQKRLVVDAFARYRIKDPLRFYQTLGSKTAADSQLAILLNSALRRVLGEATFIQVVRDQRAELMARIRDLINHEAEGYGIQVVDARIRRADLPEQNSQAVYQRMQTERQREAAEFRAQGHQRAQEIRSRADREVTVLVAEATSQIRADPRRRRRHPQPDLRRRLQPGPGLLRLLPLDAGLRGGAEGQRHALAAQAGHQLLPLLQQSVRQAAAGAATPPQAPRRRPVAPALTARGMRDFLAALGLVFVIEGLVFAAFPAQAKRAMASVMETPERPCA